MGFLDLARHRKSCRRYTRETVTLDSIERCLQAARLAPSACNSQPWKFLVIKTPEIRKNVAEAAFSGTYAMNAFAKDAPVLVLVVRELSKPAARIGQIIQGTQYNLIDIGIAAEHFVLQAAEEGLGTCWLGWFDAKKVKKVLGLSHKTKIEIVISLGHPLDAAPKEKNRKALNAMSEIIGLLGLISYNLCLCHIS